MDAAHEAKIVHRDIKPENIMIRRRDGLVKVLDFGLAKLTEKQTASGLSTDTEAATVMQLKTIPGMVMGTVNYMSPEQAQGLHVDARTDIWSMGIVLYEMAAGHVPFSGATSNHTVVDILEREPASLQDVPAELERIVRKALAKKPGERYQTTKDLLIDLKNFRKRMEIDAELERSLSPLPGKNAVAGVQTQSYSSSRKMLVPVLISAAVIGFLAIGFGVWRSSRSNTLPPAPATAPALQLNYWVAVQKYRDGNPFEDPFRVPGEMIFEKDYRVQFNVSSPQGGHLYILNEGPSAGESLSILFPTPTANSGSSLLVKNQQVKIPEDGWFKLDAQQGTEKLWLVFSPSAISELEAVKAFANKKDRGEIKDPDLNKAAKAFIDMNSASIPTVEKSDDRQETSVRASGNMIVHLVKLAHH